MKPLDGRTHGTKALYFYLCISVGFPQEAVKGAKDADEK